MTDELTQEAEHWKRMTSLWLDWERSDHGDGLLPPDVQEAKEYVMSVLDSPGDPAAG